MSLAAPDITGIAAAIAPGTASVDPADLERLSMDVFEWEEERRADIVLAPADTKGVATALVWAARQGFAVAPRGGGMSYTRGFQPRAERTALLDLGSMSAIRVLSPEDRVVVVEAGCTWSALEDALKPHGLRPALEGPISGGLATIGGAVSQNMPAGMHHVLGLELVLVDGRVLTTGVLARPGALGALRASGPDLTGLFIGDCGALAVKTAVALRLVPRPAAAEFASFGFPDPASLAEAMAAVQARGSGVRVMGLAERSVRAAASATGFAEGLALLRRTVSTAGSLRSGLARAARLAMGAGARARPAWGLHLIAEAGSRAAARALLAEAVAATPADARPIPPTVPIAMQSRFYSVRGMLGPKGERWAPVHGVFPLGSIGRATRAIERRLAELEPRLQAAGITHSMMFSAQDANVLIEPMLYWPDSLRAVHAAALRPEVVRRFAGNAANEEARALAREARSALRDVLLAEGAMMAQLGRYYPYEALSEEPARRLARSIKTMLDPDCRLNPGNLGWDRPE